MAEEKLVTVTSFPNRHFAEIAKSLLDSYGIESFVAADDAGGALPGLTLGVELKVKEKDLEKAKRFLGGGLKEG